MRKLFCKVYAIWLAKLVGTKQQPTVRLLDLVVGSECKYCMAVRCLVLGVGIGRMDLWGLVLVVTAIALTLGERYWLCEVTK
jgi:hypothetical protein